MKEHAHAHDSAMNHLATFLEEDYKLEGNGTMRKDPSEEAEYKYLFKGVDPGRDNIQTRFEVTNKKGSNVYSVSMLINYNMREIGYFEV
ncbi:hypothetical protein B1A99_25035 [Cohnella sp. CIP 111063]|uniref:hypothetical protein n=1 Tax=unclassified Cohnella TaxID=2636738 RepID=UPI000B8C4F00|nr:MULTISPECIES: hypothetical protein [unclassified Cohnella]OXS55047.1 hypothetical protein B1A99_25035 [Cohnella sp. CIP 111063]